ncbi:Cytochrome P450 4c3, partial [Stegodyphus mimosarum]
MIGLHPWVQDKIHQELDSIFCESNRDVTMDDIKDMKYLECVVKETLRLYPSVPGMAREITEDVEFQGRIIPKGATCVVFTYCLHRDPEVFPNPEKFDPDRFLPENSSGRHPFAYVPFSAGPRNCIGQCFAMMEAKTMLSFILRKYHVRSLDPRDKVLVADEIILRPKNGLRIEIKPRGESLTNHPPFYYP